jgi:hypothetical protein
MPFYQIVIWAWIVVSLCAFAYATIRMPKSYKRYSRLKLFMFAITLPITMTLAAIDFIVLKLKRK